jgi:hypothetical protein
VQQTVSLKLSGLTMGDVSGNAQIAYSLRWALSGVLNVDVSTIGQPVFSVFVRRRLTSSGVQVQFTVASKGPSTAAATANTNAALQTGTATSDFVTYFTSKANQLNAGLAYGVSIGVVGSMAAVDSTPTKEPTLQPTLQPTAQPQGSGGGGGGGGGGGSSSPAAAAAGSVVGILAVAAAGYLMWRRSKAKAASNGVEDTSQSLPKRLWQLVRGRQGAYKAAQKGAQKISQKGALKVSQKGSQKAAPKGAQKGAQKAAQKGTPKGAIKNKAAPKAAPGAYKGAKVAVAPSPGR